jgi:hypothetical protein
MRNETVRSPRPDDEDPIEPVRNPMSPDEEEELVEDDEDVAVPR